MSAASNALTGLGLREAGEALAAGRVSSLELTEAALSRIGDADGKLGAFLAVTAEEARAAAREADRRIARGERRSLLDGIPLAVKDLFLTKGIPTTAGSRILEGYRPPYTATAVEKLTAAGAVLLGKLNLDEFAMGSSNENSAYKPCRNPWDLSRTPGGSSGGSAAAVAARLVHAALGTDTGGSIREPASLLRRGRGEADLRPGLAIRGHRLRLLARPGRAAGAERLGRRAHAGRSGRPRSARPRPPRRGRWTTTWRRWRRAREGSSSGFRASGSKGGWSPGPRPRCGAALATYEQLGATLVEVSLPHSRYGDRRLLLVATAEASSNLARYDGVRFGLRAEARRARRDVRARRAKRASAPR